MYYLSFLGFGLGVLMFLSLRGTRRNEFETTVRFLGKTLYERSRNPMMPTPTVTFEFRWRKRNVRRSERNLWERLNNAGIPVIGPRSIRSSDVGSVKVHPYSGGPCCFCGAGTWVLHEVSRNQKDIDRPDIQRICAACEECGYILSTSNPHSLKSSRIAPHVRPCGNLFDVLDMIEQANTDRRRETIASARNIR